MIVWSRWLVASAWTTLVAASTVTSGAVRTADAQQPAVADASSHPADTRAAEAVLARKVSVDMLRASLKDALDAVAKRAGTQLVYRLDLVTRYTTPVSLHVTGVSLATALDQLLAGTALRVLPLENGHLGIVEMTELGGARRASGIIEGRVTDAKTQKGIRGVSIVLDDNAKGIRTDDDGHYRILGVASGSHRVTTRYVGFGRQSKVVTVTDDAVTTVDFVLEKSVLNTLDQVVVTATGEQRIRELGHVVSQINADSLVREAPITNLSELLTARVPGLQVLPGNGGVVGGEIALRLRGQTTAFADPQPIVIVDGVRYKNTNTLDSEFGGLYEDQRPNGIEARSLLNDLNVNDIEKVEVVKGPSASTLYGPDASNGVILITTKRGAPGKPKWHVYAYPDLSVIPNTPGTVTSGYRIWGHDPYTNALVGSGSCLAAFQVVEPRQCVLDSITVESTVSAMPEYSVLAKSRPQWHSGASVSGGTPGLTYFFSGNMDSQTGALKVSPVAAKFLQQQLGTDALGSAIRTPNTQKMLSMHTAITSQLNASSSINLTGAYTQSTQRGINIGSVYERTLNLGVPEVDSTQLLQYNFLPTDAFLQTTEQHARRFTANLQGTARAFGWLDASVSIGTDLGGSIDHAVEQAGAEGDDFGGQVSDFRRDNTGRSADLRLTGIRRASMWSFRTSLGTQYTYAKVDGLNSTGTGLAPGSSSISTATSLGAAQVWSETVNLGGYGEEVVGLNDRLFLTGSVRVDGSTSFGDAYHPRPFPKAGISWILSDEPFLQWVHAAKLDEVRFRSSYGVASRYPNSAEKYGYIQAGQTVIDGTPVNVFDRRLLANPDIRPERTREWEYGADLTIATNAHLGLTWWNRRTHDQLSILSAAFNYVPSWANVGDVAAHGFEATFTTNVVRSRQVSLDLNATYAFNTNKLLSRGSAPEVQNWFGSLVVGYPLDASFGQTVASFADTAHGGADGVLESQEVTLTPTRFLGVLTPPKIYTYNPVVSLLDGYVRISTLIDRQTGGVQLDRLAAGCGGNGLCIAPFLVSTPLAEQAKFVSGNAGDFIIPSDFTRWRELSLTLEVPQRLRERVWLSRAAMSIDVRNLALWTHYKGPDPESIPGQGTIGLGATGYANSAFGIPQARSWQVRFDITP